MAHLLVPQLRLVEERFDAVKATRWMRDNWTLSLYANAVYVALVFLGRRWMRDRAPFSLRRWMRDRAPFSLRRTLTLWNTGLATFSILGFVRFFPDLQAGVLENGFSHSHSHCSRRLLDMRPCVLWALLFVLSKVVEFGDTAFIVLRKTPLNFLHWYHHISVFAYSSYSAARGDPTVEWFCTIRRARNHADVVGDRHVRVLPGAIQQLLLPAVYTSDPESEV